MSISVVLPTSNELGLDVLPRILDQLESADVELIAVDNASDDGTAELLAAHAAVTRLVCLPDSNRAQRLSAGIALAGGNLVLLHHPRSLLAHGAIAALHALPPDVVWGGFTHAFDHAHRLLAWTSWYSNRVRLDRRGIVYLDHCLFCRRDLLTAAPLPALDIFEDTALSASLRRAARPQRLPQQAVTSAVRYARNGVWRQATMNQVLKVGYALHLPHRVMNRLYERGLSLNG